MKRVSIAFVIVLTATACSGSGSRPTPEQTDEPGWTGRSDPTGVILARQAIMSALEEHMLAIDTYTVDDTVEPDDVLAAAEALQPLLLAVPHLFPPTTNLYDPESAEPVTTAMPAIWMNFDDFTAKAAAAHDAAKTLAQAENAQQLHDGSVAVRAACDACHKTYLLPYERGTAEPSDFDFDSIFEK